MNNIQIKIWKRKLKRNRRKINLLHKKEIYNKNYFDLILQNKILIAKILKDF